MKFIVLTLAFVCLAQNAFGAPSQAGTADTTNLDTFKKGLDDFFADTLKNWVGEDHANKLKEAANTVTGEVNKFLTTIGEKSKEFEPEAKEAVKKFQDKINEHLSKFRTENPELAKSAESMKTQLEQTVKSLWDESKKLDQTLKDNTSGIREDLQKFTKEAIDKATAQIKELQTKLGEKKP